jgi:hypothetical protein
MNKWSKALLVLGVAVLLLIPSIAMATTINRSPDATFPHSSALNHPSYWGENCRKYESGFYGDYAYLPSGYTLLVLKSAQSHFVWYNPPGGFYGTPTEQDISHSIACRGEEVYEPCSETITAVDRQFSPWSAWQHDDPNQQFVRTRTVTISKQTLDARNTELVCDESNRSFEQTQTKPYENEQCGRCSNVFVGWVEWVDRDGGCDNDFYNQRVEYPFDERCYGVCEETKEIPGLISAPRPNDQGDLVSCQAFRTVDANTGAFCSVRTECEVTYEACSADTYAEYGPWSEWVYNEGKEHRSRTVKVYDATTKVLCSEYVETDSRCKDLFRMWLLWDENGRECYIVSDLGHPSVGRQKTLCFPCSGVDFVSIKSWSGMVDSCDNWELDEYRSFERLHGQDLRDVWQRHKDNGPRCDVECE